MSSFDLDGEDVGQRTVAAMLRAAQTGSISLTCRDARFRQAVNLDGITFSRFDAAGAVFDHGLTLAGCRVSGDLDLTCVKTSHATIRDVHIGGSLFAQKIEVSTFFAENLNVTGYSSFDQADVKQLAIRDASFGEEARFRAIGWDCSSTFFRVVFGDEASFDGNRWAKLRFDTCTFAGTSDLKFGEVAGRFALLRSRMMDLRRVKIECWQCRLERTRFEQPVIVDIDAERVNATDVLFERGLDLTLSEGATLVLAGASLAGESLIRTSFGWSPRGSGPAQIDSLRGTRLERLTLKGLDLRECAFSEARTLDAVVISGRGQLATDTLKTPWGSPRELIADENAWRKVAKSEVRPDIVARQVPSASEVAETYRALRRGREAARDRPGAGDFYYGEMEMRRLSAERLTDRLVLSAYWILSGYGLRAWRAFVAYVVVVIALTAAILMIGLQKPAGVLDVAAYVLSSTTALTRPNVSISLTVPGVYLQLAARLMGPVLFALMVFAVRERLRR